MVGRGAGLGWPGRAAELVGSPQIGRLLDMGPRFSMTTVSAACMSNGSGVASLRPPPSFRRIRVITLMTNVAKHSA